MRPRSINLFERESVNEGREFEIEDDFAPVDHVIGRSERPRRSWSDERKPAAEPRGRVGGTVENQCSRARERLLPATLTRAEWSRWRHAFKNECAYCGDHTSDPVMDHVMPLALGGGTTVWNVLPACSHCNTCKGSKHPFWWITLMGWEQFSARLRAALERMNEKA